MNILVTGASGEVGYGLIDGLSSGRNFITALDIRPLEDVVEQKVDKAYVADVTDAGAINRIVGRGEFDVVYHLASVLSTGGEKNPELAHRVNVYGTFNLLDSLRKAEAPVKFVYPSSIAVYGGGGKNLVPITMYGINKLYCEGLGVYFSDYYKLLSEGGSNIDFRCVRFPGLISTKTMPTGGTTDYAPEVLHAAMKKQDYECFVRRDSCLPFMAMEDGARALVELARAPKKKLKKRIYDIGSFSAKAGDFEKAAKKIYPEMRVSYKVDEARQRIVDSWPSEVDDKEARKDWGWKPRFGFVDTIRFFTG